MNPEYFKVKDFEFESGESLPELTIEYTTFGTKKLDDQGYIINAVLYLHGWSGSYRSVGKLSKVFGPSKAVDTRKFFIISPTALGSANSSSPSTSGLGPKFPKYTVKDMIRAHKELISNKLKIKHLKGIIGNSMGGFQALQWATEFPDFMDFLLLIVTGMKSTRQMYAAYDLMSRIITHDPAYKKGNYAENPQKAIELGSTIGFFVSLTPEYFEEEFESDAQFLEAMNERNREVADQDANDLLWRNGALLNFNIEKEIDRIEVSSLLIGIEDDQIFPPKISSIPLNRAIGGSKLFIYNSIYGHYGGVQDLVKAADAIGNFLQEIH